MIKNYLLKYKILQTFVHRDIKREKKLRCPFAEIGKPDSNAR